MIAPNCVMESIQPAPDGTRYEGHDASFSSWKALIDEATSHFVGRGRPYRRRVGAHPLALRMGPGPGHSVRGVNVMRVVDGKIVEAAGYSKTAPIVALED